MPPRRRQAENEDENEPEQAPNLVPRAESVFLKHNPPSFNGLGDPMDAEKWEDFKHELYQKYIPDCYREAKEIEFWNLKQGNKTVSEYDREFNQLSRHAPHLVDTDGKKARKFKKGLRSEIGIALAGQEDMSYARTLAKALSIEAVLPQKIQPSHRESGVPRSQPGNAPSFRPCQKCGRMHPGVCRANLTGCYNCGKEGHFKRECPKGNNQRSQTPQQPMYPQPLQQLPGNQPRLQQGGPQGQRQGMNLRPSQGRDQRSNQGQRPPQPARTYALNQQQAAKAPGNLAGMITLLETPVLALFDTGASHSFIAESVCKKLKIKPENAKNALEISIPSGKKMMPRKVCSNLELNIEGENFKSNLYVIKIQDFDIILGMDWLASANASISCPEREVTFRPPGKPEVKIYGSRLGTKISVISALKATKMIRKNNCQEFLVNLIRKEEGELSIKDVPVVREYPDVFPKELPGLPPDRQKAELGFILVQEDLRKEFEKLRIKVLTPPETIQAQLAAIVAQPDLRQRIIEAQRGDDKEEIVLNEDLAYEEKPQAIVDRKIQKLRNKEIDLVKVIWNHHGSEEATWELESELLKKYPDIAYHVFPHSNGFQGKPKLFLYIGDHPFSFSCSFYSFPSLLNREWRGRDAVRECARGAVEIVADGSAAVATRRDAELTTFLRRT
ncbi:hypothetical protein C2S52_010018 [Perilla frutescens var. hirtella]|nr:hypothetical protein C2S52_010018 [Perilla frutescens var. hirtella]